jgi:hypothetical protein
VARVVLVATVEMVATAVLVGLVPTVQMVQVARAVQAVSAALAERAERAVRAVRVVRGVQAATPVPVVRHFREAACRFSTQAQSQAVSGVTPGLMALTALQVQPVQAREQQVQLVWVAPVVMVASVGPGATETALALLVVTVAPVVMVASPGQAVQMATVAPVVMVETVVRVLMVARVVLEAKQQTALVVMAVWEAAVGTGWMECPGSMGLPFLLMARLAQMVAQEVMVELVASVVLR